MHGRARALATALAALAIALACVSAAHAARWAERPFKPNRGGAAATCLRSAGPNGQIAVTGPLHRHSLDIDFLRATPAGLRRAGHARMPPPEIGCPAVAAGADGTAVVAEAATRVGRSFFPVVAAVRDPGRRFRRPRVLSRGFAFKTEVIAAAGDGGDLAVAWIEESEHRSTLKVARRRPNGSFGAPVTLASIHDGEPDPAVGIDASGRTTVTWTVDRFRRGAALFVTSAPRDGPFRRARMLAGLPTTANVHLTVTPAGRALLTVEGLHAIRLFERPSAGIPFRRGPAFREPGRHRFLYGASASAADDGSAVVAWQFYGTRVFGVRASARAPGGRFRAPAVIDREGFGTSIFIIAVSDDIDDRAQLPADLETGVVRTALAPGGRSVVTWAADAPTRGGDLPNGTKVSLGSASDGFDRPALMKSPCRGIENQAAVAFAGGGLGAVFDDSQFRVEQGGFQKPFRAGRLHLALPGIVGSPPAPPPKVHLSVRPLHKPLGFEKPLHARVRCSAACDVRLFVPSKRGFPRALGSVTLHHAGRRVVPVVPWVVEHVAPRHPRRVRVVAHACTPGSTAFASASRVVAVRRAAVPRLPRLRGVKAVRNGQKVIVVWHTRRAAHHVDFDVVGLSRRKNLIAFGEARKLSAYYYRSVLHDRRHRVKHVEVSMYSTRPPHNERSVTVRVR